jgi:hypothetical protein
MANNLRAPSPMSDDDLYSYLDDFVRDCFLDLEEEDEE